MKLGWNIQIIQAIDEDEEKSKEFAQNPEFLELISPISTWFQRVNSRVMKEI